MDTRKLEALLTAVELGSFTRAAEVLGYTQSGLTHMMNSLEKDIGFTVLVRGRSGVQLTPAGQRLLPLVRDSRASSRRTSSSASYNALVDSLPKALSTMAVSMAMT